MSVRQYIGARYVPRFSDVNGGVWSNVYSYEPLTIVKNGNDYYTSKQSVPVGIAITNTDYWVKTGDYNGAIANLDARLTSAENSITSQASAITTLDTRLTSAESNIVTNYRTRRRRNFIIIGDSFGAGVISSGQPLGVGWIQAFKQMWADAGHGSVYYNVVPFPGVSGFASSLKFLTILTDDIEQQITDKHSITDIVVLGGTNDQSVSSANVRAAVTEFCNYCKTNYPYARLAIGVYGSNKNGLANHVLEDYRTCVNYGAEYISDLFNLICDPQYISDGTHLTQAGYNLYNPYVCQAIIYGHVSYRFKLAYVGTSSEPMLRFVITERCIMAAVTKYNAIFVYSSGVLSPFTSEMEIGSYSALPVMFYDGNTFFANGDVYSKDASNKYHIAGHAAVHLDMTNKKLILRSTMYRSDGTDPSAVINNDWHDISTPAE